MINIGNYRESFLKLFCMEFKLRKCFFLRKFNDKKIISLRPVEDNLLSVADFVTVW